MIVWWGVLWGQCTVCCICCDGCELPGPYCWGCILPRQWVNEWHWIVYMKALTTTCAPWNLGHPQDWIHFHFWMDSWIQTSLLWYSSPPRHLQCWFLATRKGLLLMGHGPAPRCHCCWPEIDPEQHQGACPMVCLDIFLQSWPWGTHSEDPEPTLCSSVHLIEDGQHTLGAEGVLPRE